MQSILFFDDFHLATRHGMERRQGRPKRVGIYRDPHAEQVDLVSSYPNVFQDPDGKGWRMLYNGYWPDGARRQNTFLLAESVNGLDWGPCDTRDSLDLPDRILPHQVLPCAGYGEAANFVDERASPDGRFKALVRFQPDAAGAESRLYTSPDGLHWSHRKGADWINEDVDLPAAVYWNDVRRSYMITCRPRVADRRVAIVETADWKSFAKPQVVLQPDALDTPLAEFYGMPVVKTGGIYVGFLWVYHTDPDQLMSNPLEPEASGALKYLDGKVDCQLAYSFDGAHFQRGLRETFIGGTDLDEPESGVANPYSMIAQGDDWLIFASASRAEHGRRPVGSSAITIYRLRRDGFVYLETSGTGTITTRALRRTGVEFSINAEAPWGEVRAELVDPWGKPLEGYSFDDCKPFVGDSTAWSPEWANGGSIASAPDKIFRLRLQVRHGRLYGVHGDFDILIGTEIQSLGGSSK